MAEGRVRQRIAVALLSMSAAGFAAWKSQESFSDRPIIPTKGDVPTIGHGSTRYEDGTPVKMTDPPITRERADQLARNLNSQAEKRFIASLPGVELYQEEFDLYMNFTGQFGFGTWRASSIRRDLLAGSHRAACGDLLKYRFQAGRDCSLPKNWGPQGCKGVWRRQQTRHRQCMALQGGQDER